MTGDQGFHQILGHPVSLIALHQDLLHILVIEIAERALDQVRLLVNEGRRDGIQGQIPDVAPQFDQVFVIAGQFGLAPVGPGGAHDHRHARRHGQAGDNGFQALAVLGVDDLARNPTAAPGVWHQNAIAPGQRQIGGQRGPLVAALLLDHLNKQDLAALDDFLDLVFADRALGPAPGLYFVDIVAAQGFDAVAPVALLGVLQAFIAILGRLIRRLVLGDKLAPVGDRNLVIVGMDFAERQKAVAIAAEIDKSGLQGRLDPGYLGQIDITL